MLSLAHSSASTVSPQKHQAVKAVMPLEIAQASNILGTRQLNPGLLQWVLRQLIELWTDLFSPKVNLSPFFLV
jgi:hypothetical protein